LPRIEGQGYQAQLHLKGHVNMYIG